MFGLAPYTVKIGFKPKILKTEGRPNFRLEVFLKLYLYGYLNGVRSSRRLEKECFRNIEVQWLLEAIHPNYHSISDFRKDNPKALKQLFKLFVLFLKDANLIAKLQAWNTPYKRKCLFFSKKTCLKLFYPLLFLEPTQINSKLAWHKAKIYAF